MPNALDFSDMGGQRVFNLSSGIEQLPMAEAEKRLNNSSKRKLDIDVEVKANTCQKHVRRDSASAFDGHATSGEYFLVLDELDRRTLGLSAVPMETGQEESGTSELRELTNGDGDADLDVPNWLQQPDDVPADFYNSVGFSMMKYYGRIYSLTADQGASAYTADLSFGVHEALTLL